MSVTALLEDDLDIARGDVLCAADAPAQVAATCTPTSAGSAEKPAQTSGRYLVKHTTRTTRAELTRIEHRVDVGSLRTEPDPGGLELNDIGRVALRTAAPLVVDRYADNRATGSFILIDEATNETVAAGMVVEAVRDGGARSPNVVWERGEATREDRWAALGQRGATIWLTGLPSSGKSAIAAALEARLVGGGTGAYLIDGDNLRHGLSGDLGFDAGSRAENVRRAGEAARMLADAGLVVLVALVSPYAEHRDRVRRRHAEEDLPFVEVYVDTPLEVCEAARPQGPVPARPRGHAARADRRRRPLRAARRTPTWSSTARSPIKEGAAALEALLRGARAAVISYLVCATPRSGSTLLCETLSKTGVAGNPREFFEACRRPACRAGRWTTSPGSTTPRRSRWSRAPRRTAPPPYSRPARRRRLRRAPREGRARWGATPNGVFGAKIMWAHLEDLGRQLGSRRPRTRSSTSSSTARGLSGSGARTPSARPSRSGAPCRRSRGGPRTSRSRRAAATRSPRCATSSSSRGPRLAPGSGSSAASRAVLTLSYEEIAADPAGRGARARSRTSASTPDAARDALPTMRRQADERSDAWAEAYAKDALATTR